MVTEDVILLVSIEQTQNAYGVWEKTETTRQVFCKVSSVSQSEFFEAGRNGLNPEWRFVVFGADYEDEETVIYNNKRYGVYRTYRDGDFIELYVIYRLYY
jgi:SPP1 family predicted phage head-tail adaptor